MPRIVVDNVEPDPSINSGSLVPEVPAPAPKHSHTKDTQTDKELEQKSGTSVLAAFSAFPTDVKFSGEYENEDVLLLLRAHIITNLPWILISLGGAIFPLILLPLFGVLGLPIGGGTIVAFVLFWYAGIFTYGFLNFLYWYFNVYIVTNERVVDIDWYSIIYKKVSATQISKIQDVHASQGGVFAGIFDYGDVEIQTAGTEINFEFTAVPHPQLVAKKIQELMAAEELEWEHSPNP